MKYSARSPTQKDHGGLLPVAFKARSIQALFGAVLVIVLTTLFMAVFTIGETMSIKVHFKKTFVHWPINLQLQELESAVIDGFDIDAGQRHWNSSSLPAKDLNNSQVPTQQGKHRTRIKHSSTNRTSLNGPSASGSSAGGGQQLELLTTSNRAGGENGLEDQMDKESFHQANDHVSTRGLNPSSKITTNVDRVEEWVQMPDIYSDSDETEQVMLQVRRNGTLPCHNVRTKSAKILGLPPPDPQVRNQAGDGVIQLHAGPVYELLIVSIGDDDQTRCQGGDYYETDLSGPLWKSRPPVVDLHNGTYAVHLQMDPRFAGRYTFTVVLLFANFHALHFHPQKYARMEDIATFEIEFSVVPDEVRSGSSSPSGGGSSNSSNSSTTPAAGPRGPALPICRREDFDKKHWSGRWTREKLNEDCEYDKNGRWQCVDPELECQKPWCEGPVGSLESNGWVYSAHCAFKIFRKEEAWKCLDGKWLFFWGDSNHMDTIRNLLNFVLGFDQTIKFLDRRMDLTFSSPPDNRSSVRITSMFNGHSNVSLNYEGLYSLHNEEFQAQLRSYFSGKTAPDVMVMNSGLHDGLFWRNLNAFLEDGVEYATHFWSDVWSNMTARRPDLLYRTTVATGGQSRNMSFNPHKMELFNHIIVDKLLQMKLERFQIIDGFDYTFAWHWDHKTNDGVHYGRPPVKDKWAGNNIGHRYFVDLMLVHILLNAICVP